jgi:TusA-related sulfurtransferase
VAGNPLIVDARGLEPPEPLERVVEALDRLKPGQRLLLLLEREPYLLYHILEENGYEHSTRISEEGTFYIEIRARD